MFLQSSDPDIKDALKSCRYHIGYAAVFNSLTNLLLLAFPLFLMNIANRVIESKSLETLIALCIGFFLAFGFRSLFEILYSAIMRRVNRRIDRRLSERLARAAFLSKASGGGSGVKSGSQVFRDLDAYRRFVSGSGIRSILDAPWAALFVGVLFLLDPAVGLVSLIAAIAYLVVEVLKFRSTRSSTGQSSSSSISSYVTLDLYLRNAEAIVGQGMMRRLVDRWRTVHDDALSTQLEADGRMATIGTISGLLQYVFLGIVIAVAAVQIVLGNAPPAILFAILILFRFALRPIQGIIASWGQYIPVKQGLLRIEEVLAAVPVRRDKMQVPRPTGILTVKEMSFIPAGTRKPILRNINFGIEAGRTVGIVGLAGAGKSTLARILTGCIKPTFGQVRLDGNEIWDWAQTGEQWYVGYLPQSVQIIPATVAENIGHFGEFDDDDIVRAAQLAGAHEMILRLPNGYDTAVGTGGHPVSGGQRQLIGLARAIVGDPALIVLDEPNSNLDGPGEEALMRCIAQLKAANVTVVMISHRPNLMSQLDKTVLLKDGQMVGFGETSEVYAQLGRPVLVRKKDAN